MNPNRQREPEINIDDIANRLRSIFGSSGGPSKNSLPGIIIFGIFTLSALIWLGTGFYTVQPGEQAAIRNFGTYRVATDSGGFVGGVDPGLHWYYPAPIGTLNVVAVDEIRRLELGFRGETPIPVESLMISGDTNIVDVQLLIQYNTSLRYLQAYYLILRFLYNHQFFQQSLLPHQHLS